MSIDTIGIIGAGVMGGGIAQFFAERGARVLLWDADPNALWRGIGTVYERLKKSAEKGSLTEEQVQEIMSRLGGIEDLAAFRSADLVIEAIVEDASAKKALLAKLGEVLPVSAIIGTNTSSLSVTELAEACPHPKCFLGIHFFNPPTKLELVEVVPAAQTAPGTVEAVQGFLREYGKTPVVVKDSPGFIVNRLLLLMINEAARMVDEGVATAADIDTAMRLGALHPAGPLAVADLIGLDTCEHILEALHGTLGESSYAPADGITQRVKEGKLGRKSGEGFFTR
ncbi:MAG: 3-hydroxyacyl-CoA dehydrogenase family protein [Armatimonadota bacterium]